MSIAFNAGAKIYVACLNADRCFLLKQSMESLDISNGQTKTRGNHRHGKSYGLEQLPGVVPTIAAEASR